MNGWTDNTFIDLRFPATGPNRSCTYYHLDEKYRPHHNHLTGEPFSRCHHSSSRAGVNLTELRSTSSSQNLSGNYLISNPYKADGVDDIPPTTQPRLWIQTYVSPSDYTIIVVLAVAGSFNNITIIIVLAAFTETLPCAVWYYYVLV